MTPKCKCHNKEMKWGVDRRLPLGGSWRCHVKLLEAKTNFARRRGIPERKWIGDRPKVDGKPLCLCHNLPMKKESKSKEKWRCAVKFNQKRRERYREDSLYWLKIAMSQGRNRRLRRIRQDELSHS